MKLRYLGQNGPLVSAIGLGCVGMSSHYGSRNDDESLATLHRALDLGVNFIDTADIYGKGHNEQLISKVICDRRNDAFISTKFGCIMGDDPIQLGINGKPEYVRSACEASLQRLGIEVIDLYYLHRADPQVPIEETVGAMANLVQQGKVRFLGLSEASPETLRRAHKVYPISALESEYSLWTRDVEAEILPTCRELGVGFVAFCPLGRGFLTGQIKSPQDFAEDDLRRQLPRFQGDNFQRNLELVERLQEIAAQKNCQPSQLVLAWLLAQGEDIVPIPGTKRRIYLEENVKSVEIELTADELAQINQVAPQGVAAGSRYPESVMRLSNR